LSDHVDTALVTGGAGFIGSHLVRRLLAGGMRVRVLDNFATGRESNLAGVEGAEVMEGDVRSRDDARRAVRGVDVVFHLAALPSVARSWKDPVASLAVNAHGTANMVEAALEEGAGCFVYSSSSSVYGDQKAEVKTEDLEPRPISPYGYAKLLGEKIALAYARSGRLRVYSLRYFNVFGPRQDPESAYAAVIPLFMAHALAGTTATIDGDGTQSRDFTYIDNVVDANVLAYRAAGSGGVAMNVACGQTHTLLELVDEISRLSGRPLQTVNGPPRQGDIKHSLADVTLAAQTIGYEPRVGFRDGLRRTFDAYRSA
jgi:UDP-N-acetylglucosamine/UDP-N-acetyl-alpha-D-glucosaminouronate 4-epimerase